MLSNVCKPTNPPVLTVMSNSARPLTGAYLHASVQQSDPASSVLDEGTLPGEDSGKPKSSDGAGILIVLHRCIVVEVTGKIEGRRKEECMVAEI